MNISMILKVQRYYSFVDTRNIYGRISRYGTVAQLEGGAFLKRKAVSVRIRSVLPDLKYLTSKKLSGRVCLINECSLVW